MRPLTVVGVIATMTSLTPEDLIAFKRGKPVEIFFAARRGVGN